MSHFAYSSEESKELVTLCYKDIGVDSLSDSIHNWFVQEKYTLKEGDPANGTYTSGNRVMRLLFGAFSKYFAFEVHVRTYLEEVHVDIRKASTGMSGGVIGMNQMKKELQRVATELKKL